jgi:hypothetical protein
LATKARSSLALRLAEVLVGLAAVSQFAFRCHPFSKKQLRVSCIRAFALSSTFMNEGGTYWPPDEMQLTEYPKPLQFVVTGVVYPVPICT